MTPRISVVFAGILLAAVGLFSSSPQTSPKVSPTEAARLNNLGSAYMNQQLFEKGLELFRQAAELDPKLTIARLNQGIALLNLQKIDEARAALEDAIKQDAKIPNAWYNLGLLDKNTGDSAGAIEAFHHVVDLDANDPDAWYFLGASYVQAKQFPQAIEAFEHALKINPLHASAEFGLSRAYQQSGDVDHARENLKKFQYITQNKIGAPISLAYGEQGQYSRVVESPLAVLKPPEQIKVRFVDVTREVGIGSVANTEKVRGIVDSFGPGACFLDFDGDGKLDIFVSDNGPTGGIVLYRNKGNGEFEDFTKKAGLDPTLHGMACTAGDYDNDGWTDLAVVIDRRPFLFHNEKNGTFKDVTQAAGIKTEGHNVGLTFIDYDHDGDLDLYVTTQGNKAAQGGAVGEVEYLPALMFRNNGDGKFTDVTESLALGKPMATAALGTDYNNDRAVDLVIGGIWPMILENPREGKFLERKFFPQREAETMGVTALDFNHDGWMDLAFTRYVMKPFDGGKALTLWRNNRVKGFEEIFLPEADWGGAYGIAAFDYDNDGWVDLVAVGETKEGKGEIKLFRNLGAEGFKDVTANVGLDKIHLESPRAIITGDYDNDGATDLLITQNHGPAVLLRNEGGNQNHWLRLSLKGLADNKSAIGTKVEVFSGGNRQKFEIAGSNGYLGQNSTDIVVGLGESKEAEIVRMLWPTGVLQDEIHVAGDRQQNFTEIDRRGSSCPTLFVWNGQRYEFVADMLGAGVVGHWIGPGQRDVPRPVEWVKIPHDIIREKPLNICHPEAGRSRAEGSYDLQPSRCNEQDHQAPPEPSIPPAASVRSADVRSLAPALPPLGMTSSSGIPSPKAQDPRPVLSFRFMEPLEEAVYLDQVRLLAVDHPADTEVYPNEYFASNPPYPEFKVVTSKDAEPPAGAWDEHEHDMLSNLRAHRYFGDFKLTQFQGFALPHSLTLDLGEDYRGGPLWLLMHGEVEYFSANSMYAASQAGVTAIPPDVEALGGDGKWKRVIDDMGFPAGGPRTMTADLTGKLPVGTRKIRITTNLQVYWDSILIDRGEQAKDKASATHLTEVPLAKANLQFHGYPLKIEGMPPGNVNYIYEKTSATGPYTRPSGVYTRYGDVLPLLTTLDDKLAVFGSGDEVQLDFDPSHLPALPAGWVRDYFFAANGYEKDMDFYAAEGNFVAPLPFLSMSDYPYTPKQSFPMDDAHVNYLLEYNTRSMSGNEQRGYWFDYGDSK